MIKSIQNLVPGEATVTGVVDGVTMIGQSHYLTFRQPDDFPRRERLLQDFHQIGARRQGTADQPFPNEKKPIIGVGLGGALIYVPYNPTEPGMRHVGRLCHVEFQVATKGNAQNVPHGFITRSKVTYHPKDSERTMAGMR